MLEVDVVRRRRAPWVLVAVAAAVIVVVVATIVAVPKVFGSHTRPAARPFNIRSVGVACPTDHTWICGSIRVPLDRSSPRAGSLIVRYRVLPRTFATQQSAGTIVVVTGGPGSSSMSQHAWAQEAFQPLLHDHDLLLVDDRGTGASGAINCPQAQTSFSVSAIAQCRKILGSHAGDYSTVAAVDDLAAVLRRLHSRAVDLYGESYGTFFAQVFALRHPQHLERLVLDGALGLDPDPWRRDSLPAGLAAIRATCRANSVCRAAGDPVALIAKVLYFMRSEAPSDRISIDASELASLLVNAGRRGSAYRELPSALLSYLNGDHVPLLRLFDETTSGESGAGPASTGDSEGLLLAATCADEPQPFDLHAGLTEQKRQLDSAYAAVVAANSRTFLPFTPEEALSAGSPAALCLGWPPPARPPLGLSHQTFPDVPTLVLEGGLDTVTPPRVARAVAHEFRRSHYVEVPFVRHIAAFSDSSGCAASIATTFIRSRTIASDCLAQVAPPDQVNAFPELFGEQAPIQPLQVIDTAGRAAELSTDDLAVVATARDAIADVWRRWGPLGQQVGSGLRGGTFEAISPLVRGEFRVRLNGIKWSDDTAVSGALETSDTSGVMSGSVIVATPFRAPVKFDVRATRISQPGSLETLVGTLDGRRILLIVAAKLEF
jgi:pimeloyl-ACP methyl ester carboxylesterase